MQDYERQVFDLRNKIVETLARNNKKEVVIASTVYKGGNCALILQLDGHWRIQSPMSGYLLDYEPDSDRVLEKFTKLADPNFNVCVGDIDFYDEMETYLKKISEYVKRNRLFLSAQFLDALKEALRKIS